MKHRSKRRKASQRKASQRKASQRKASQRKARRRKASQRKASQRKARRRKSRNKNQLIIDNQYRVIKRLHTRKYRGGNPGFFEMFTGTCEPGDTECETRKPYESFANLGEGSQGTVELVQDTEGNNRVMKTSTVKRHIDNEFDIITRMMAKVNETPWFGSNKHKGLKIVKVYKKGSYKEMYSDETKFYLIMDHIPGVDLFITITQNSLSEERMVHIILQITRVVDMMHSMSPPLFHNDIKPENIMVTSSVSPPDLAPSYLIDFGYSNPQNEPRKGFTDTNSPVEYFIQSQITRQENTVFLYHNEYIFTFTGDMIDRDLYGIASCIIEYCIVQLCNSNMAEFYLEITEYVARQNEPLTRTYQYKFINIDAIHDRFNQKNLRVADGSTQSLYEYLGENHPFVRLIQSLVYYSPKIDVSEIERNSKPSRKYVCRDRNRDEKINISGSPITTIGQLLESLEA